MPKREVWAFSEFVLVGFLVVVGLVLQVEQAAFLGF